MTDLDAVRDLEQRALHGDPAAWNALIRRYTPTVEASLHRLGADDATTRDIVQDTWLHLLQQQRAGKLTFLHFPRLATVQARHFLRMRRRRADVSRRVSLTSCALPPATAVTEDDLDNRRRLARAAETLASCPARKRAIFLAYQSDGRDAADVAPRFGISVQRVRQTACEIRKHLRASERRSAA
jgi:RNA polymerase sigma-70 factor (ECF subfamily)